jgi:hypothetical protein
MKQLNTGSLEDVNGNPLTDMSVSFTSKPYKMAEWEHYGIHLFWDNIAVQGTMLIDFTCDPVGDGTDVANWVNANSETVDGTFLELMFLKNFVPISAFRIRWVNSSGSATMTTHIVRKRG